MFKFTSFYLFTRLPETKIISRVSNVVTVRLGFPISSDGDIVTILTVNLWVRPAPTDYNRMAQCICQRQEGTCYEL